MLGFGRGDGMEGSCGMGLVGVGIYTSCFLDKSSFSPHRESATSAQVHPAPGVTDRMTDSHIPPLHQTAKPQAQAMAQNGSPDNHPLKLAGGCLCGQVRYELSFLWGSVWPPMVCFLFVYLNLSMPIRWHIIVVPASRLPMHAMQEMDRRPDLSLN